MKTLRRYPEYKASGVEWLGEIPSHWSVVRSDAVLEYRKVQIRKESFADKRVFHYSIPAIQETGDGLEEDGSEIDSDKISLRGNELLVSKLNPRKGCVLLSTRHDLPVVCSTEFVPLVAKDCHLRFAFYLYSSELIRQWISATVQSVTRSHQRANPTDISKIWIAVPPDKEQRAIAEFLDRETARIDGLVAKKERLIELLQEKRTALISHAVTKGLNPNTPMKDSGVEWIGGIPAHWTTQELRRLVRKGTTITYGIVQAGPDVEGGIPYIRTSDMSGDELPRTGYLRTSPEIDDSYRRSKVSAGDIGTDNPSKRWQSPSGARLSGWSESDSRNGEDCAGAAGTPTLPVLCNQFYTLTATVQRAGERGNIPRDNTGYAQEIHCFASTFQ